MGKAFFLSDVLPTLLKLQDFLSDCNETWTHNHLVRKRTLNHLAKLAKWLSSVVNTYLYGAFDCMFYHALGTFQSESTLYSCLSLNVKELLAWNRRKIWSFNSRFTLKCKIFLLVLFGDVVWVHIAFECSHYYFGCN